MKDNYFLLSLRWRLIKWAEFISRHILIVCCSFQIEIYTLIWNRWCSDLWKKSKIFLINQAWTPHQESNNLQQILNAKRWSLNHETAGSALVEFFLGYNIQKKCISTLLYGRERRDIGKEKLICSMIKKGQRWYQRRGK